MDSCRRLCLILRVMIRVYPDMKQVPKICGASSGYCSGAPDIEQMRRKELAFLKACFDS